VKKAACEFDLYVPLVMSDGGRVSKRKLAALKSLLLSKFGGVTYFPQNNEGLWKFGNVTFRDKIVILRVIATTGKETGEFFDNLKKEIQRDWKQKEVLIVSRQIRLV
jgi:hypothetical protein